MYSKMGMQGSKPKKSNDLKNPLEALRDLGSSTVNKTTDEFKKMGSNMFDSFFGGGNQTADYEQPWGERSDKFANKVPAPQRKEFSLFNYSQYYEKELVRKQIKELTELVKREIELIKKADSKLLNEVKDIQKINLESLPDKPGVYHIRFLELVLSILRTLRQKIGESRTWLQALTSRKKKRGSLFMARSKKQGTQYSLSQELQNARSIQ